MIRKSGNRFSDKDHAPSEIPVHDPEKPVLGLDPRIGTGFPTKITHNLKILARQQIHSEVTAL
jgi:hypothetical protein